MPLLPWLHLTDPAITQQIVTEMQGAIAEACRVTMQEAVVNVAARLRGYNPARGREDEARVEALRERLFPGQRVNTNPAGQ